MRDLFMHVFVVMDWENDVERDDGNDEGLFCYDVSDEDSTNDLIDM